MALVADGYEERPFASRSDVVIAGMAVAEILEGLSGVNLGWQGMELETGASLFLRKVTDEDASPGETLYREELTCREHMSAEDRWDMFVPASNTPLRWSVVLTYSSRANGADREAPVLVERKDHNSRGDPVFSSHERGVSVGLTGIYVKSLIEDREASGELRLLFKMIQKWAAERQARKDWLAAMSDEERQELVRREAAKSYVVGRGFI
jgi:hypothetical protein